MGTRNLTCVVKDGKYVVSSYGQWDGYPSGQGKTILDFLNTKFDLETFKDKISKSSYATDEDIQEKWVECGANPNDQYVSIDISKKFGEKYPELSRDTGGKILELIQNSENGLQTIEYIDFISCGSCEWAYVIDLDLGTFEVYKYNSEELTEKDRFFKFQKNGDIPAKLVRKYKLDRLPKEKIFIAYFKNRDLD